MTHKLTYDQWVQRLETLPVPTRQAIATALLERTVEIYVNSTEQCNFRCRYCYEEFLKGRMSPSVVERVKRFLDKRSTGPQQMYLNWFGGEPLIASDIVLDISRYAKNLCAAKGIGLSGSVTTNAWNLTPALMSGLVSAGLTYYQVTVDGDQEGHDRMRVRADGSGTFSTIWRNLLALRRSELEFSLLLRVHLRPDNFESVRSLLAKACEALQPDRRFVIGVRPLEDLGGPTGGTFDVLGEADCEDRCRSLKAEFGEHVIVYGTGTGAANEDEAKVDGCGAAVCYACKSNAFLIRSDGRIGKCTVALDKDFNTVGVLDDDGSVRMDTARLRKWTDALYTLDPAVLACPAQRGEKYFRDDLVTIGS
jgi:uncharacterized protein